MRTRSQKGRNSEENEENEAPDPTMIKSKKTLVGCTHASKFCKQSGTKRKDCVHSVAEASHKVEKLFEESIIEKPDAADLSSVVQQETSLYNSSFEDHNTTELHWEDGTIYFSNINDDQPREVRHGFTVEFNDSPSTSQRKTIQRASAKEKELAELVHKVHLLCLLSRGRLVDSACRDSLIQASVLSLLPAELLKISDVSKLTTNNLSSLVRWIRDSFQVCRLDSREGFSTEKLAHALAAREGTAEEVVALSVALFRALNIPARFVSILDVAPLKPEIISESSLCSGSMLETRVSSSRKMVRHHNLKSSLYSIESSSTNTFQDPCQTRFKNIAGQKSMSMDLPTIEQLAEETGNPSTSKTVGNEKNTCSTVSSKETKRKGDLEFEMQLEMALTATAAAAPKHGSDPSSSNFSGPLNHTPLKKVKKNDVNSHASKSGIQGAVWSRKSGATLFWSEVYCSGENLTGRWVHVDVINAIIDGEEQVEVTNATYRNMLRYVVAFAGNGAKDVTRRYCTQWYKIAPHRVFSKWWDAVLTPLKELESRSCWANTHSEVHMRSSSTKMMNVQDRSNSTGASFTVPICSLFQEYPNDTGIHEISEAQIQEQLTNTTDSEAARSNDSFTTRSSLEDMELETRALTEPLPTNQQAYRNHPLYAIERLLTKYQILHPKGPVLGFCSGYPVYPRACVQTLQTKQKWLREALQLKPDAVPAKVITRSAKLAEKQVCESTEDKHINIELYGKWQTEPLCLPHAVNGVVPKNERGQVDVWSEKCLPPGTVHLRFPRLVPVANRLGIDFAPAMIGFEFLNGRSVPIFEGIVVCSEFKEAILAAYYEEEERREFAERKRSEVQALSRWYQLLYSMVTRQRLSNSYEGVLSSGSQPATKSTTSIENSTMDEGENLQKRSSSEDHRTNLGSDDNHEHIFPLEDQSYEEESSLRTKRCPCGFSIQVEEL